MSTPFGLIAGEGSFPLLVARGAHAQGKKVIILGFRGSVSEELRQYAHVFEYCSVWRPNKWLRVLKRNGVSQAIMVGRVAKTQMTEKSTIFHNLPDWRALKIWFTILRKDKRPQTVLTAMLNMFASQGIELIDSTTFCKDQLATPGPMTKRAPTEDQWQDIHHGWERCNSISRLDIGQAMAVLHRDVIAVEAIEGTNAMIERAGTLCKMGGWICIKVSNKNQDMRLDVPTVGTTTIEKLHAAKASCLVLEPGKTIMLEKEKVIELAEKYQIAIVGYAVY